MENSIRVRLNNLLPTRDSFSDEYLRGLEDLLKDCINANYPKELCEIYLLLGLVRMDRGQFNKSIHILNEATDLADSIGEYDKKTKALGLLATIYGRQHLPLYSLYYRLEVENRLNSLVTSDETDFELAKQFNNIGTSYIELERYDKAEEYLLKSLLFKDNPYMIDEIYLQILGNIIVTYARYRKFDEANKYVDIVEDILYRNNSPYFDYIAKAAKAEFEYFKGNVAIAHAMFKECLTYSISEFGTIEDVSLIDVWTKMLRDYKMHQELSHLTEVLKSFSSELDFDFDLCILESEYLVAKQQNNLMRALKKLEKLTVLKDDKSKQQQDLIFNNLDRIVDLQKSYSSEKKSINKDELSNCYNRKFLKKMFNNLNDSSEDKDLAFIILDVDAFKEYNDNYGHVKGDEVLRIVSESLIKNASENNAYAIRYGGDEFLIFAPDMTLETGIEVAKSVYQDITDSKIVHEYSYVSEYLTITMGVATYRTGPNTFLGSCVAGADVQLYKGKEAGRNCIFAEDEKVN